MSIIKKFDASATTKTHGVVDGSLMDLINPFSLPGDSTTAALKTAVAAGVAWVGRGYRDTSSFSL